MKRYSFETGVYRPPSEGGSHSLLVRFTRNCPWNRCGFCAMYKDEKFDLRSAAQIKTDIDAMAALAEDLKKAAHQLGHNGVINQEAAFALMKQVPELNHHQGFAMVYHWLASGAKTVFLQDANSLIMPTDALVESLQYLRKTFPTIERVTSYARSRTLVQKTTDELKAIHDAGLDRLHVGLETGDDDLLKKIRKGVSAQGHIEGGRKVLKAGFQLSEYWMPGLGGQEMWESHALNTAKVINAINPHYIRSRPFFPLPGTPMQAEIQDETVVSLSPKEQLGELKLMVEALEITSNVCFDHAGNYWKDKEGRLLFTHSYEGYRFPAEKQAVLARIAEGLEAKHQYPNINSL